jgi:hypothetical protein
MEEKDEIKVIGTAETFDINTCQKEIPLFWQRHNEDDHGIHGIYGICSISNSTVKYMIADPDHGQKGELQKAVIPGGNWIVFADHGPLPFSIQKTEEKMAEWRKEHPEKVIVPSIMVEYYSDPCTYEKGGQDEQYAYEVWIKLK